MANNKIQIKRSISTGITNTSPSVSNGELIFTSAGYILAIGDPANSGNVISIGGARYPGTLTANQAIVTNSTSGVDQIKVGNLAFTGTSQSINANGDVGSAGYVFISGGASSNAYWAPPGTLSINVAAQYTWTNVHTFTNTVNFTSLINVATGSVIANSTGLWTTGTVNAASHTVGSIFVANSTTLNANGLVSNLAGGFFTGYVNASGFSTTGNANATNFNSGANLVVNSTNIIWTGNTTTSPTVSIANNGALTIGNSSTTQTASIITVANSAGNVQITPAGISGVGTNITSLNASAISTGTLPDGRLSAAVVNTSGNFTLGGNTTLGGTNTVISSNLTTTGATITGTSTDVSFRNGTFSGNLTVSGTVITVNTAQLMVNDNIIQLAYNQTTTDTVDTGWSSVAGNASAIWYSGIARIAASSNSTAPVFRVFVSNTNPNTSATIDTTANTKTGYLQSYLAPYGIGGAFIANATNVTVTANSTLAVSISGNTISLSGRANNDLLFTNGAGGITALAFNTTGGYVLQSNGTAITYDTLDGGTF